MAANTGERTLISALIPPGAAHIDGIYSLASVFGGSRTCVLVAATFASMLSDFSLRAAPRANIRTGSAERLPIGFADATADALALRILRLSAMTYAYAALWTEVCDAVPSDAWTGGIDYPGRPALADVGAEWSTSVPLRRASDRRQALIELDALVALALGVSDDELCTIYRTQFPVLAGYDREAYVYDANGRLVPNGVQQAWRRLGDRLPIDERTAIHPASGKSYCYELPFNRLDREGDLRQAYAEFSRRLMNSA